jgi:PKD repeat protein
MSENETGVSYEQFFVNSSGDFVHQPPDLILPTAHSLGLQTYPLIWTADSQGCDAGAVVNYPSRWAPFISAAISVAKSSGYSGYNVDWEGFCSGFATNFSSMYAHFLWAFANASHAQGLRLSVDVAWYSPSLWNASYLSATSVDVFYDMDYYSWYYFWNRLDLDLANYPHVRLGIGLAGNTSDGNPCPGETGIGGYAQRLHIIESYNITHTAFWAMADGCWDYPPGVGALLHDYLYNGSRASNWTVAMGANPDGWAFCPGGFNAIGSPPVLSCNTDDSPGTNITLYTANETGAVSQVNVEGNETITRMWSSPLSSVRLNLWEYLGSNITLFEQNLSCSNGGVVSSSILPSGTGWLHRNVTLAFPTGSICGLRLGIATRTPGQTVGWNDWFANIALEFPSPLKVSATASPSSGYSPLSIEFSSQTSGGFAPYSYSWNFGDGHTSALANPSHTFNGSGNFTVGVTVTDTVKAVCEAYANVSALTAPPLTVTASGSPLSGTVPLTVRFSSTPSGGITPYRYQWNLGDGASSTSRNVSHTYNASGMFSAKLTVTDSSLRTSIKWFNVTASPVVPLTAVATGNPLTGPPPLTVTFNASPSGGTPPYSYGWKFGDGAESACRNPTHEYNTTGTFDASFTATDQLGDTAVRWVNVTVSSNPQKLSVTLTASPVAGTVPLRVEFKAVPSGGTGSYMLYKWDFGDGTSVINYSASAGAVTIHSYTPAGTYYAQVVVNDSSGNTANSSEIAITVTTSPQPGSSSPYSFLTSNVYALILLVATAAVVIGAVLVWRHRRKRIGQPPWGQTIGSSPPGNWPGV